MTKLNRQSFLMLHSFFYDGCAFTFFVTVLQSTTPKNGSYPKFELNILREWCVQLISPVNNIVPTPNRIHLISYLSLPIMRQFFFKIIQHGVIKNTQKMNQIAFIMRDTYTKFDAICTKQFLTTYYKIREKYWIMTMGPNFNQITLFMYRCT